MTAALTLRQAQGNALAPPPAGEGSQAPFPRVGGRAGDGGRRLSSGTKWSVSKPAHDWVSIRAEALLDPRPFFHR